MEFSTDVYVQRLADRIASLDGPMQQRALILIGLQVQNQAKVNLTRRKAISTNFLRESIKYLIMRGGADGDTVQVGAYGVPYAKYVEEGSRFDFRNVMAMCNRGVPERPSKGIVAGGRIPARPYLVPALKDSRDRILAILVDMIRGTALA